jgi:uncharacterized protein YifN (PemK superfamily)
MPIRFPVRPGTLLLCDYDLGGFRQPEMVKRRPAIVVSPRLRHRDNLCAVVPLSSVAGERELPYVVKLKLDPALPPPFDFEVVWAKCDMIATVCFQRLDLFHSKRDQYGKRTYLTPALPPEDFLRVKAAILAGLGFGDS